VDGVAETVWFDPESRPEIRYAVSAVDRAGNESARAEEPK